MIIACSKLLYRQHTTRLINDGALVIRRGIIVEIGPSNTIIQRYPSHRIMKIDNAFLIPGLINIHTHLELPPLLTEIHLNNFSDWIINLILQKKKLGVNHYRDAVQINIHTVAESGVTTIAEICTHKVSPEYLKLSGLRAYIFNELICMSQQLAFCSIQGNQRRTNLLQSGLSPHSPFTVTEPLLKQLDRLCKKKSFIISMHISESRDEIRLLQRKKSGLEKIYKFAGWDLDWAPHGSSSIEYLQRIGFLSPNLLAVHAVQVSDADIALIKKHRVSIAHCPRSNKNLGVGRMPLKKMLDAGITVGLGTDSLASVPTLNMWDEMRYALKIHKKDGVTAEDIFKIATIGGAKALGLDKEIGTLEPGKKADIIAVPLPKKNTGDIYSDLIRETKSSIMTMVNGKILWNKCSDF